MSSCDNWRNWRCKCRIHAVPLYRWPAWRVRDKARRVPCIGQDTTVTQRSTSRDRFNDDILRPDLRQKSRAMMVASGRSTGASIARHGGPRRRSTRVDRRARRIVTMSRREVLLNWNARRGGRLVTSVFQRHDGDDKQWDWRDDALEKDQQDHDRTQVQKRMEVESKTEDAVQVRAVKKAGTWRRNVWILNALR